MMAAGKRTMAEAAKATAITSALASWLLVLAVAPAPAQDITVGADSRSGLTLTVYNRDLALIDDRRRVTLPAGESRLVFEAVSPAMKPESVLLRAEGLRVLEQNFQFDLLGPRSLLEASVGGRVQIVKVHPQSGEETLVPATLLSVANGVVLRVGDRIETGEAGRLVFESLPEGLSAEPVLAAQVASEAPGPRDLTLGYLTAGLTWKADYVAEMTESEDRLDLTGLVTLTNASGLAYPTARLRLVAGEVHQVSQPPQPQPRMVMMAEAAAAPIPDLAPQPLGDQQLYELDRPVSLARKETKQVALLSARAVPLVKLYRFTNLVDAQGRQEEIGPVKAAIEIRFRNDKESGLDRPLPAGILRVYQAGPGGAPPVFLGENRIAHSAKGEEVRLEIGRAFDITGRAKRTAMVRLSNKSYESAQEIVIENAKDQAVQVQVIGTLPQGWRMLTESHSHVPETANRLRWNLQVPPGGKANLSYRVRVTRP
jgi:hypothetical protein